MSLFDFMSAEDRTAMEVTFPAVEEYPKADLLAFEKEVLGIYVSGHPMDDVRASWEKQVTAKAYEFVVDEETGAAKVSDGRTVTIGGMITNITVKMTKNNQNMAFLTLEDLTDSIEIVVFPRDYEKNRSVIMQDAKVFIRGRVSLGADDPKGKLICERMIPFDAVPRDVWVQFSDMTAYQKAEAALEQMRHGQNLVIFLSKERAVKRVRGSRRREDEDAMIRELQETFGTNNVRIVEKKLEDAWEMR